MLSSSASQCLNQLGAFVGPNILRGRVENYNPRLVFIEQNENVNSLGVDDRGGGGDGGVGWQKLPTFALRSCKILMKFKFQYNVLLHVILCYVKSCLFTICKNA